MHRLVHSHKVFENRATKCLSQFPISRGTNNSVLVQSYKVLQKDCAKRLSHSPISRGQFSEMENFLKNLLERLIKTPLPVLYN